MKAKKRAMRPYRLGNCNLRGKKIMAITAYVIFHKVKLFVSFNFENKNNKKNKDKSEILKHKNQFSLNRIIESRKKCRLINNCCFSRSLYLYIYGSS